VQERTKEHLHVIGISVTITLSLCIIVGIFADFIVDFLLKYLNIP
jgi:hypothetical protein